MRSRPVLVRNQSECVAVQVVTHHHQYVWVHPLGPRPDVVEVGATDQIRRPAWRVVSASQPEKFSAGGCVCRSLASQASSALMQEGAEHVYAAVIGDGIEHFHLHLIPRYPGTPREYWWVRLDEWPDAPRGDARDIETLTKRLRAHLA